ncbi:PCNA-associated factor-like [Acropora palmata]|uniref:PCNA-associated factor-like n=1 Tax=Acropora palmata TaxID=6131 RepID=UPI003DA198BA
MVRTKADGAGRKAAGAKAPRKQVGGCSSSSAASSCGSPSSSRKNKYAGGNPVKWWPSPKWQKGIGDFFCKENSSDEISQDSPESSATSEHPGVSSMEPGITPMDQD